MASVADAVMGGFEVQEVWTDSDLGQGCRVAGSLISIDGQRLATR